ncbi:MAG: ABC transporter permease [Burkholderiales bacterium]|nr:ABC transporter permease [Burkholderiales bacterium]
MFPPGLPNGNAPSAPRAAGERGPLPWSWLLAHVIGGYARQHPLRVAVQVLAIAIGVALGYAVHLINASALAEFSSAVRQVTGQADASVTGAREGFDETLYARVAADPAVALASPVLELELPLVKPARLRGRSLTLVGVDLFRVGALAPQWIGEPMGDGDRRFALLDDGLFLSPAALQALGLQPGDTLTVQVGGRTQPLRVAGRLPAAREGHVVAAMDLGFAQWRLDRLGLLSRIDLQLTAGASLAELAPRLALPPGVALQPADAAAQRASNLSRAYRVNLNVLALVALFTGAFLVYSLQAQAVLARRTQLAFLRVIGTTRREVERLLLAEAAVLGALGALLGVAGGLAIASAALKVLGGDLGGGYFAGVAPSLVLNPGPLALFFALGVAAAVVGGGLPAREAARARPALALKAGSGLDQESEAARAWPGLALAALALLLLQARPLDGIPLGAYLAIALLLVAAILLKPLIAPLLFKPLARAVQRAVAPRVPLWLAATRLAATPRFAAIGAAGIVASFALMVAMATMVASFRTSVDQWLGRVLPADVYVRAGPVAAGALGATTAAFPAADQQALAGHPQVERAEFARNVKVALDPARAPVALIARPVDRAAPERVLPMTGSVRPWRPGEPPPAWVSEAMVEIYGAGVGSTLTLPLARPDGSALAQPFIVSGVWRDYARQTGAVMIDAADYERLTGQDARTEAALWLKPGAVPARVIEELAAALQVKTAKFAQTGEIRAISLRIFDRSFAVTYVLEIVAIVIGLVGIGATFSAQAIVRTKEFGVLRHVGVTRQQVLALLAIEGLLITLLAIVLGLAAGLAVAWILVAVVNPQSFYWTMDFRLPWGLVLALVGALLTAATLTALLAGRRAVSGEAIYAVREDW